MKKKNITLLCGFTLILIFCTSCFQGREKKDHNIILITVDALRADHMGLYGYEYDTSPRLDEFAEKAILFSHPYCPIPKTSASIASLMTGIHPLIHGTKPNRDALEERHITLAEALKMKGYETHAVVDNGNLSKSYKFHQGFDEYIQVWNFVEDKPGSTPFITDQILEFLKNRRSRPFFLWAHYIETHTPYLPPPEFVESRPEGRNILALENRMIAGEKDRITEDSTEGEFLAFYDGAVKYIDDQIGKVLDLIKSRGLDQNSVIIISSDHGEDLGEYNYFYNHGPLTFHAGTRIPLIVSIPGHKPKKITYPVSLMDIYPTVFSMVGLSLPYEIQGRDLFKHDKERMLHIRGVTKGMESFGVVYRNYHFVSLNPGMMNRLGLDKRYLFDIYKDPLEKDSIYHRHLNTAEMLDAAYRAFFDLQRSRKKPGEERETPLTEREKRNLRTLGYIK
jgi:arylsulfatase